MVQLLILLLIIGSLVAFYFIGNKLSMKKAEKERQKAKPNCNHEYIKRIGLTNLGRCLDCNTFFNLKERKE